jgi:hypothetical protein
MARIGMGVEMSEFASISYAATAFVPIANGRDFSPSYSKRSTVPEITIGYSTKDISATRGTERGYPDIEKTDKLARVSGARPPQFGFKIGRRFSYGRIVRESRQVADGHCEKHVKGEGSQSPNVNPGHKRFCPSALSGLMFKWKSSANSRCMPSEITPLTSTLSRQLPRMKCAYPSGRCGQCSTA